MSSRHILGFSILKTTCLKTINSLFSLVKLQGTEEALWCLGHQHPMQLFSASRSSVGGNCRLKSCRCLHPCRAPGEKSSFQTFVWNQFPGDDARRESFSCRIHIIQTFLPFRCCMKTASHQTWLPLCLLENLPIAVWMRADRSWQSAAWSIPGISFSNWKSLLP